MRALLDVNVLVAALDSTHAFHRKAQTWLSMIPAHGWASCPLTESGCLRIMINPRYPNPHAPVDMLAKLETAKFRGYHEFWSDDLSITNAAVFDWGRLRSHQQVTDVYLLALAVVHGGRFVTFDRRIRRDAIPESRPEHLETL